jgi:hypothetical protein
MRERHGRAVVHRDARRHGDGRVAKDARNARSSPGRVRGEEAGSNQHPTSEDTD